MQRKVEEFNKKVKLSHKKEMPILARIGSLQSEIGELTKEVLKASKYGTLPFVKNEEFENEFGDVLYNLLSLANETNIDVDKVLNKAIEKYEKRLLTKNNMGSKKDTK